MDHSPVFSSMTITLRCEGNKSEGMIVKSRFLRQLVLCLLLVLSILLALRILPGLTGVEGGYTVSYKFVSRNHAEAGLLTVPQAARETFGRRFRRGRETHAEQACPDQLRMRERKILWRKGG